MQVDLWVLGVIGSIVVACVTIAINATLKFAESNQSLKSANEDIARLSKQLDSIQDEMNKRPNNNCFPNSGQFPEDHTQALAFDEKTATWIGLDNLRYCANCKASGSLSPMRNDKHGWLCPVCDTHFDNPENPRLRYAGARANWRTA